MTKSKQDIILWGVFYLIAHGGILLIPNAIYWDDWVLYRATPESIIGTFTQQAGTLFYLEGYLHVAMLEVGPWVYKVLTFLLMFAAGILLNGILKRHTNITTEARFFIVLLFLLLPFNIARIALIDFRYTLCYFLFFLAWALMDRFRFLALTLFFVSFNTNSLLVFYALPIMDMLYRGGHMSSIKSTLRFGLRRIDYMLLPFVYFFIKIYYFAPSGDYKGYNESYGIMRLLSAAKSQMIDLFNIDVNLVLCLLLSLFTVLFIKGKSLIAIDNNWVSWRLLALGLLACFLGVFPYWILGHVPTFVEWTSRHQLLLPLGGALVIVAFLYSNYLSKITKISPVDARVTRAINMSFISIIIGASLALNVSNYAALFVDWQKQQQLMHLFAKNAEIERARLIVIEDKTTYLNALGRKYRFYEWNGILEVAFGDEKRFAIPQKQLGLYLSEKASVYFQGRYKAGSFRKDDDLPSVLVEVNLVKPEGFRENIMNGVFPRLALSVSEFEHDNAK